MDTFELLPTLAQGELSDTSTPELVAAIFRSRASGTLWLETAEIPEIRIFFRAGDMCGTGTFTKFKTLAHVLLENDLVDALEIEASQAEAQAQKKRHGEVLLQRGSLTPEQLRQGLAAQHRANLKTLLQLDRGKYEWRGWETPPPWAREVSVDPVGVIVDALEEDRHTARRERVVSWLGEHGVKLSADWADLQGRIMLDAADLRAISLLSAPRAVAQVVRSAQLSPMRAEALLVTLLLVGAAEPSEAGALAAAEAPGEPELAEADVIDDPEPLDPVVPAPAGAVPEDEAIRRLESLSLDEPAPRDEEPLELDTERSHTPPPRPPPPPSQGISDERAREMRKRMLARGLRNLGVLPAPAGEEEPESPPAPRAELDLSTLTPEERQLVEEVRSKARIVETQNAYARLNIAPTASDNTLKLAYLDAAKRYHPDRASTGKLSGLLPDLQRVFTALKEAYESIATPDQRARYDEVLKSGGAMPGKAGTSRREEAAVMVKMGDVLLKKRDFDGALAKLRRAVDLDANGDTLAALAWALASDPKSGEQGKSEAQALSQRALKAPAISARTHYVAGVFLRTKDPDAAAEQFRKALALDAGHSDAALELRLIEQRRGKAAAAPQKSPGGIAGLFGKRKPSS